MRDVFIVSAVRTAVGRFGGGFKDVSPVQLAAEAMKAALERAGVDGANLDFFTMGNVLRAGHGQLIPRQAALRAGISDTIDGYAVDMVCSSGMMAVLNAALAVRAGEADLVLAGGVESMSQTGFFLSHKARWGYKLLMGDEPITDILMYDGLTDPTTGEKMGDQTERLAAEHGVTRAELDEIALHSHLRAADATADGRLAKEIVPIEVKSRRKTAVIDTDEGVRADSTSDSLAGLRPAFRRDGVLTAGNSSQISDGAAALVVASREAIEAHGLTPIARLLGGAMAAGETWRFPEAPIPAVHRLLKKLSMVVADFDLHENNEAFALNSILFHRMLGVPYEKLNVHGGAIAMGHPIGASGARILVTLLNALRQRDETLGLAAICHGTGGGTALALERTA